MNQDVHAALCFALWHHQGSSSTIGQPIRKMLDLGPHDHMGKDEIAGAKRVQSALSTPASNPLTDGLDVKWLNHCMIAVRDWLGGGCDTNDIPLPEIAALVAFTDYGIKGDA